MIDILLMLNVFIKMADYTKFVNKSHLTQYLFSDMI